MIKVYIATELIRIGLLVLALAKRLHPKLFATFRVILVEQLKP
jgi:hypothetical protein